MRRQWLHALTNCWKRDALLKFTDIYDSSAGSSFEMLAEIVGRKFHRCILLGVTHISEITIRGMTIENTENKKKKGVNDKIKMRSNIGEYTFSNLALPSVEG